MSNEKLAWDITQYMVELGYYSQSDSKYDLALEWLGLCSNIEKVIVDPGKYDDGLLYCGTAWDFAEKRSKILADINLELMKFLYSWNALECLADELVPKNSRIKETIHPICQHLKSHGICSALPQEYFVVQNAFLDKAHANEQMKSIFAKIELSPYVLKEYVKEYVDDVGVGIYVVSKIRNQFAHGSFVMPYDEETEEDMTLNCEIVSLATTMTLLCIVMLLYIDAKVGNYSLNQECMFIEIETECLATDYLITLIKRNISIRKPQQSEEADLRRRNAALYSSLLQQ